MFGFFKKYNAHLCSAVSGRILDSGKPLVGVKIERELRYIDNKKRIDKALTDEMDNLPCQQSIFVQKHLDGYFVNK